ncbi:MAG: DUF3095 family protein [Lewinella sp.]|uniref:DUF3095 family protein n=1 Tax=Lewinella sp. TaxID=2004506 RepID=UPI003D6A80D7
MKDNQTFYSRLPTSGLPLHKLLGEEQLFEPLPADWHVIVVDVEDSTLAVEQGLHHDVNFIATGSIIAVSNKVKEYYELANIPYFFGGDGATFLVPAFLLETLLDILDNYRRHVKRQFGLVLRVGGLAVAEVYQQGVQLKIAKLKLNNYLVIPVILGNGLKYTETLIKARFTAKEDHNKEILPVNLEGMNCRWNEIAPPSKEEKILCLLVSCSDEERQAQVYHEVVIAIDRIFGKLDGRQPISAKRLKLSLRIANFRREMYGKLGRYDFTYILRNWLLTFGGRYYFKWFEEGKGYLKKVRQLSSTLMLDGNINSVIAGTDDQIAALITVLDKLEKAGDLIYGAHITYSSIMSCYVLDYKDNHVHFVDGTEGGYTTAAKMFKAKLAQENI